MKVVSYRAVSYKKNYFLSSTHILLIMNQTSKLYLTTIYKKKLLLKDNKQLFACIWLRYCI